MSKVEVRLPQFHILVVEETTLTLRVAGRRWMTMTLVDVYLVFFIISRRSWLCHCWIERALKSVWQRRFDLGMVTGGPKTPHLFRSLGGTVFANTATIGGRCGVPLEDEGTCAVGEVCLRHMRDVGLAMKK